jgi:hypothetical protein
VALPRRLARDYLPNDSVIPHFEIETGSRHPASPCRPFPVSLHLGARLLPSSNPKSTMEKVHFVNNVPHFVIVLCNSPHVGFVSFVKSVQFAAAPGRGPQQPSTVPSLGGLITQ